MTKLEIRNKIKELNKQSIEILGWEKFNIIYCAYLKMFDLNMLNCYKTHTKEVHEKYLQIALMVNDCCF